MFWGVGGGADTEEVAYTSLCTCTFLPSCNDYLGGGESLGQPFSYQLTVTMVLFPHLEASPTQGQTLHILAYVNRPCGEPLVVPENSKLIYGTLF